jgi:prevent-host-death family protein
MTGAPQILLVDDRPDRDKTARQIEGAGFGVAAAVRVSDALELLAKRHFDVAVTDATMPDMSGVDIVRAMRSVQPDLPVIVMLKKWDNVLAIEASERGAVQCLARPVGLDELKRSIELACEQVSAAQRLAALRRRLAGVATVSATEAKNKFGAVLERTLRDGAVMISKRAAQAAVLISMADLEALVEPKRSKLDALTRQFDALYARMQENAAQQAAARAFDATPDELGAAAVRAARRR